MVIIASDNCAFALKINKLELLEQKHCAVVLRRWMSAYGFSRKLQANTSHLFHNRAIYFISIHISDCSLVFAIEAATLQPAKCLGIENTKGTLNFGADADFVMLNDDLRVQSTWISGNRVYSKTP